MSHSSSTYPTVRQLTSALNELIPPNLAFDGDAIGLQLGDPNAPVKSVLISLDASHSLVVEEACRLGVNLVISHHALLYRPLKQVLESDPYQKGVARYIRHNISVFNAHTNWDVVKGGVNDVLASLFELEDVQVLARTGAEELLKLVTYIPEEQFESVRKAVLNAGAGHLGNYSHCSFSTNGEGTFLPLDQANPFIGERGRLERVKELRFETIVPKQFVQSAVEALLKAHPYEEAAYDLFRLEQAGEAYGIGRIGNLSKPILLKEFVDRVRQLLPTRGVRWVGRADQVIRRVACIGGAGSGWIQDAVRMNADVFLTGDVTYHDAQLAQELDLALVDPGHYALEQPSLSVIRQKLQDRCDENGWNVVFYLSNANTDPFEF